MKYSFLLVLAFVSSSAWSQVLFKYSFRDCEPESMCLYCGDTVARPTVKLEKYLLKRMSKAQFEYNGRGQKMRFQIFIQPSGQICVISIDDRHNMWQLRKELRLELNNMPDWKPAMKDGHPIASSIILEFTCHRDYFDIRYISRMPHVDDRVI